MAVCTPENIPVLLDLFQTPSGQRGEAWNSKFYSTITSAALVNPDPQVFYGPDFFPYFHLKTPTPGEPYEGICIDQALEYLTSHGLGVAINPENSGQQVEWVFTYGDILTYRMFGSFEPEITPSEPPPSPTTHEKALISQPSEALLPGYAREIIRRFFVEGLKMENPGVFVMHRPSEPERELVFSLHPEDFETEGKFEQARQTLVWFLPRHYRVATIPKESELVNHFRAL